MTYQQAQALRHPSGGQKPADIYVVGFKVCGSDDGNTQATPRYCLGIGDAAHDNVADQRLLKCIASSPTKFYRVTNAADLPDVFQQVAATILGRRLLQ